MKVSMHPYNFLEFRGGKMLQEYIKHNPILYEMFKYCPQHILDKIIIKNFKPTQTILLQNDIPKFFYVLLKGNLKVYYSSSMGRQYLVTIYNKGDFFGDLEILDGLPAICNIETINESTVACLERDLYIQWLKEDFDFSMYIHKELCRKTYIMSKKSGEDVLYPLKYRILNYIKLLHMESDISVDEKYIFKEQLAEELGTTVRSINRAFKELQDSGIIEYHRGKIKVLSSELLQKELEYYNV